MTARKAKAEVTLPKAAASIDGFGLPYSKQDPASSVAASVMNPSMVEWRPQVRSPDADVLPGLTLSRSRARDLTRNSGLAKSGLQSIVDNVIGTGLRLSARPDYLTLGQTKQWSVEWSRKTQARWCAYAWTTACHAGDTLTGDQIQQQVLSMWLLNGESVELPMWIPDRGDGYATKLQVIESDRLSQPQGLPETAALHGGIDFDQYGAPIAYRIRRTHPGSSLMEANLDNYVWDKIPRRFDFGRLRVLHQFTQDRPGQSRGIPLFAPVLSNFKQLDRYKAAEIMAAIVNACLSINVQTPLSQESIVEMFTTNPELYAKMREQYAGSVTMTPGMIMSTMPGDEVKSLFPARPATQYGSFVRAVSQEIAAGLDMPLELFLKDFTQSTYSSARAAMLEAFKGFIRRRDAMSTLLMDPWYDLWLEEQVESGQIEAPGWEDFRYAYSRARWIGPGKGYVDPVKEAEGAQLRISMGISTLEREAAELGGDDWLELLEQRAYEQQEIERLGVVISVPTPKLAAPGDQPGAEELPSQLPANQPDKQPA